MDGHIKKVVMLGDMIYKVIFERGQGTNFSAAIYKLCHNIRGYHLAYEHCPNRASYLYRLVSSGLSYRDRTIKLPGNCQD